MSEEIKPRDEATEPAPQLDDEALESASGGIIGPDGCIPNPIKLPPTRPIDITTFD